MFSKIASFPDHIELCRCLFFLRLEAHVTQSGIELGREVDKGGFELLILLPLLPKCWKFRHMPPPLDEWFFFSETSQGLFHFLIWDVSPLIQFTIDGCVFKRTKHTSKLE